jgi:hypothetical protein
MHKIRMILIVTTLLSLQPTLTYAAETESKACATIAQKCSAAGFARVKSPNKNFWLNCMKPILLGHSVEGITVDVTVIQACRTYKISNLKKEAHDLEQADTKSPE